MALFLACLAFAAWIYLAFYRQGFWRGTERLPPAPPPGSWPRVTVVIPARNEAKTVGAVVAAHLKCDFPGGLEIIVADDHSDDETRARAEAAAAAPPRAGRSLRVIAAPALPAGWTGKLNAVAAGIAAAEGDNDRPDYYLLTDADILLAPTTLSRLVAHAETNGLALTSLMARLDARGVWGGLLIPAFVYFFQMLYPFPAVNTPRARTAAAAGGVMLVRASALEAAGGIAAIRAALIDDVALARRLKETGDDAVWLGLADGEAMSLRDNRRLADIWNMVARTAFTELKHSWLRLAGAIIGLIIVYLGPPAAVFAGLAADRPALAAIGAAAWILMALTYLPTLRLYRRPGWSAFLLPVAAGFYAAMTLSSAAQHARGEGGRWKGRTYAAP